MITVKDFLNIVYDEQWVGLFFDGDADAEEKQIEIWGADWIGGYKSTLEKVEPYLGWTVDDMFAVETENPEKKGEKCNMICVTAYPYSEKGLAK